MDSRKEKANDLIRIAEQEIAEQKLTQDTFYKLLSHTLNASADEIKNSELFETAIITHACYELDAKATICHSVGEEQKKIEGSIAKKANYDFGRLSDKDPTLVLAVTYKREGLSPEQVGEMAAVYESYYGTSIIKNVIRNKNESTIVFDLAELIKGPLRVMNGYPKPLPQRHPGDILSHCSSVDSGFDIDPFLDAQIKKAILECFKNDPRKCSQFGAYISVSRTMKWMPEYEQFKKMLGQIKYQIKPEQKASIVKTPQTLYVPNPVKKTEPERSLEKTVEREPRSSLCNIL